MQCVSTLAKPAPRTSSNLEISMIWFLSDKPPITSIIMSSLSLSARLQALADTYKNTLTLIQKLQKLPFTPGTFSSSDSDPRLELSSEIHQSLKEQEDELETLRQEVEDATNAYSGGYVGGGSLRRRDSEQVHERERVAAMVAKLGEDLKM